MTEQATADSSELEGLRFPVGRFHAREGLDEHERARLIDELAAVPAELRRAVEGLSETQLDTPYRPDGWTVRQVVHHLADSHLNSYLRFKLAATEVAPAIAAYDERAWAELPDARSGALEPSLRLLEGLTVRWVAFLRSLAAEDFGRTFRHPERGEVTLENNLQLYAWHGRHHLAHVAGLRERRGW